MNKLFEKSILDDASPSTKLPFECMYCSNVFYIEARFIRSNIKRNISKHKYCSNICKQKSSIKLIETVCGTCNISVKIIPFEKKKSKSGKSFCSKKCSAIYNNTHKTTGTRRSKLEKWLESQLTLLYPNLEIKFNKHDAINSELDIHLPSLNLAFELNGIFHYEPIYGKDKLASIKNNDNRKFQACLEHNIELVIIDSSSLKYFKPINCQKYLDIILSIIDRKLSEADTI